jgi:hypothetical protein
MTYAGISAIMLRFAGVILLANVVFGFLVAGPAIFGRAGLTLSIFLIPAAILIFASKPLGRFLAAGLD